MQQQQYTVLFETGQRLTYAEWLVIEKGQVSEVARRVNNALLGLVFELDGRSAVDRDPAGFAVLNDELYAHVLAKAGLDGLRLTLTPAPGGAPPTLAGQKPKRNAWKVKSDTTSAADAIRSEGSRQKLGALAAELAAAEQFGPSALMRLLRSDIYEVRGVVLMIFARRLAAGADTIAANELDAIVQRFLEPATGRLYIDPVRAAAPAPALLADLRAWLARLRVPHPFDGVRLAVVAPRVIWSTRYDDCLPDPPISARANQRLTMQHLQELVDLDTSFVLMNRAPPGAGKSALLVPISALISRPGVDRELYVCAGQGRAGVVQFAQALYSASVPFALAFIEHGKLVIVRQHSSGDAPCKVFVGTADAIRALATQVAAPDTKAPRLGWVVIDEPTYGADIPGSEPCRELMRLVADLPPANRRLILLGATLPPPAAVAPIVRHCGGLCREVGGGLDSVQIACDVVTHDGHAVYPHTGCRTPAGVLAVRDQVIAKPFVKRIYTIAALVAVCDALRGAAIQGAVPDLNAIFSQARNLRPAVVAETAVAVLEFIASQPEAVIAAVCAPAGRARAPLDYGALVTSAPLSHQAMIIDTDPLGFAREHFRPLLDALREGGVPSAAELYAKYKERADAARGVAEAAARRRNAAEDAAVTDASGASASARHRTGKKTADGTVDRDFRPDELDAAVVTARLDFPEWGQVGTAAHRARWRSIWVPPRGAHSQTESAPMRRPFGVQGQPASAPIRPAFGAQPSESKDAHQECRPRNVPENIAYGSVDDDVQLLLLAGVVILSTRAVPCPVYAAAAWRLASIGGAAVVVSDHTACYGANMLLGTVIVTERFAAVASDATLEQAGGRLCRVGLTYGGTLVLPAAAAARLFAGMRGGPQRDASAEAVNMVAAFERALAERRAIVPPSREAATPPPPVERKTVERGALVPRTAPFMRPGARAPAPPANGGSGGLPIGRQVRHTAAAFAARGDLDSHGGMFTGERVTSDTRFAPSERRPRPMCPGTDCEPGNCPTERQAQQAQAPRAPPTATPWRSARVADLQRK